MFEDSVVKVETQSGEYLYQGLLDYCPWKNCDWKDGLPWNSKTPENAYTAYGLVSGKRECLTLTILA